jgi:hypothetical protein
MNRALEISSVIEESDQEKSGDLMNEIMKDDLLLQNGEEMIEDTSEF